MTTRRRKAPRPTNGHYELVSLKEAADRSGVSLTELHQWVKSGKLQVMTYHGENLVSAQALPRRKEDLPEFKKFKHLAGKPIGMMDACSKYDINPVTLRRWINRGLVPTMGKDDNDRRRTLVDEQHVAYCAEIHRSRGGQGHWVFNEDGTPYTPKAEMAEV